MKRNLLFSMLLIVCAVFGCSAQIFYKVEGNGLTKPSYLFGTHHFASESILDSMPQVAEALKEVDCVVGELDMTDNPMAMAAAMQPYMLAPADSTLSKLLPKERYDELNAKYAELTGGIALSMLEPMKPIVAEVTLAGVLASKEMPEAGQLDTYFQKLAKRDSVKVVGLETPEFQAQVLFGYIPVSRQLESLVKTLENPEECVKSTRELTDAYLAKDADALWKVAKESAVDNEGEFFEILLDKRNEAWLKKLPGMMKAEPLFVAVGALHLYGDVGLVEGLRKLGYTVTPL